MTIGGAGGPAWPELVRGKKNAKITPLLSELLTVQPVSDSDFSVVGGKQQESHLRLPDVPGSQRDWAAAAGDGPSQQRLLSRANLLHGSRTTPAFRLRSTPRSEQTAAWNAPAFATRGSVL